MPFLSRALSTELLFFPWTTQLCAHIVAVGLELLTLVKAHRHCYCVCHSLTLPVVPSATTQECASEYREMIADKCLHCGKGVRKTGGFSGSYYPVERKTAGEGDDAKGKGEGGEEKGKEDKVHLECWPAYEAKLAADREAAAATA